MEKMLLLTFTGKKTGNTVLRDKKNEKLAVVMKQMKNYLSDAAHDLLQPRPQAIEMLLEKAKA